MRRCHMALWPWSKRDGAGWLVSGRHMHSIKCPVSSYYHRHYPTIIIHYHYPTQLTLVVVHHTHLTYLPWRIMRKHSVIMFHDVLPSYFIRLRAYATCEWQLSQQRLCCRTNVTFTPLSHNQRLCCRTNVTIHSRHCRTIRDCAAEPMSHYIHATVTQSEIVLQNQCHITFTPLSHNQRLWCRTNVTFTPLSTQLVP